MTSSLKTSLTGPHEVLTPVQKDIKKAPKAGALQLWPAVRQSGQYVQERRPVHTVEVQTAGQLHGLRCPCAMGVGETLCGTYCPCARDAVAAPEFQGACVARAVQDLTANRGPNSSSLSVKQFAKTLRCFTQASLTEGF